MANKNIFEMLGLEFDPPDNLKKIRAAYENWEKRLNAELNTTVDPNRAEEIKAELAMDNYILQTIENARLRQHEAESLKQKRVEELRLYIDLQRGDTSGTLQVNTSQIKQIKEKLKLSTATIEATYREQGFEVKPIKTEKSVTTILNNYFISDSVMADLRKNFIDFRTVPDEKNYAWSSEVNDLYELAYYLENKIEPSADFYKRRDTDELREIFKNEAKKVSAPIPAWRSIKALLNLAQTQIFNSDDNRFRYDHSLKIESLNDFFNKLKSAPEIFKRDKFFADNCINRIRRQFPNLLNYELSAALYNKAVGLIKDPYESVNDVYENFFSLTCTNCGAFASFRTREEAERSTCRVCGENFYVECPKCGKRMPSYADHCTNCDFSFSELRRYGYYLDHANAMLDLVERNVKSFEGSADKVLANVIDTLAKAKIVKPESPDLTKIEWRMNKIAADFKKRELVRWAEAKLPSLSTHPDTAVSDCMEILRRIKDYKPARDRLRLIKPKKPLSLSAVIVETESKNNVPANSIVNKIAIKSKSTSLAASSGSNLVCKLHWQPDSDLGVVYTLVRKTDDVPKNYHDGEIIVENTDQIDFEDKDIYPGVLYGYAIFAARLGSVSEPATCKIVHYSDIAANKLIAKTEDGHCKFMWQLPSDNCLGVRILRSDNEGNNVIVADCVESPFVDRLVKNRKQYQYRLQCVYYSAEDTVTNLQQFLNEVNKDNFNKVWKSERSLKYSDGLTVNLLPELPPRPVKNIEHRVFDERVKFTWQSTGDFEIWFKEIVDDKKISVASGETFDLKKIDELLGSGVVMKRAESSDLFCDFELTADLMKIAVISATRELGVVSEILTVTNAEPCEIDKDKTQIISNDLKLVLQKLPPNVYMIHYKVKSDEDDELYATVEDAKARHMNRIYASKYMQDNLITQTHLPHRELFITVIAEYKLKGGTTVYSKPSTLTLDNRPRSEISYWLEWGKSFGIFNSKPQAKNCKLIIESKAEYTPKLYLACRKDGLTNINLKDSLTRILAEVPEYKKGFPNGHIEISLPDEIWNEVLPGAIVKLMTAPDDEKHFYFKIVKNESIVVPKK